jgi:hypothetical protein
MTVDGEEIKGTGYEPVDLTFLGSYRVNSDWVITPQISWGLNTDSGTPTVNLRFVRSF